MVSSRPILLSPTSLLACLPALAQVVVIPRTQTVKANTQVTLTAMVDGAPEADAAVVWSFPGHENFKAPGGKLLVPEVAEAMLIRVVATKDGRSGEGILMVLPPSDAKAAPAPAMAEGTAAKGGAKPAPVLSRWSNQLPFWDVENHKRFGEPVKVVEKERIYAYDKPLTMLGYGMPGAVPLAHEFAQADALLLSYSQGGNIERREVTGQRSVLLTLKSMPLVMGGGSAVAQVEGLWRRLGADGAPFWESLTQELNLSVRGLVPGAGNDLAEAGHADGLGLSARFQAPCGLLQLARGALGVADREDEVIRMVARDGTASTLCGEAGKAGYADGVGPAVRFRQPTFLASWYWDGKLRHVVADSGNHVLRLFDAHGQVKTLAGTPAVKGCKDADNPLEAQFNDPRGLAMGADGCLYVADHGNGVIRRIAPDGKVTTLAGAAGQFDAVDGRGQEARFMDLKGLASYASKLYVTDGHAIRSIALADGAVATVCGQVKTKGFLNGEAGALQGKACLNDPWGLAADGSGLLVADRGNHALRRMTTTRLGHGFGRLSTLAGDPGEDRTRWGLLRDDLLGPLPPEMGALEGPMAVLPWGPDALVSNGRCVAYLSAAFVGEKFNQRLTPPQVVLEAGAAVKAGVPVRVTYGGLLLTSLLAGGEPPRVLEHNLHMDFLDPETGQRLHPSIKGQHLHGNKYVEAEVTFSEPGPVDVRVWCVSPEGRTYSVGKTLVVKPK